VKLKASLLALGLIAIIWALLVSVNEQAKSSLARGSNASKAADPIGHNKPPPRGFDARRVSSIAFGNRQLISKEELEVLLKKEEVIGNPALLAAIYSKCKDPRILDLIEKSPPSGDTCLLMSLCFSSPDERLKWIDRLEQIEPLNEISRSAKVAALVECGRQAEAEEILKGGTQDGVDTASPLISAVNAERDLWLLLGESNGEAMELAGNSGLLAAFLSIITSGVTQLSDASRDKGENDGSQLAFVNQSMKSLGVLNTSFGENIPTNLSKAIQRTELRALEVLDPKTEYGVHGTVGDRISDLKQSISKATLLEKKVLMELRDASSFDIEEYYKIVAQKGFKEAGAWLLRRDLSQ